MAERGDGQDIPLKQAQRIRIGQHQRRHVIREAASKLRQIDEAVRVGLQLHHLKPGQRRRGGIRPMGGIGNEDRGAVLPFGAMVGADHFQSGQLPLRAGRRLQGEGMHPGDLAQQLLQLIEEAQQPLGARGRVQRVHVGEPRPRGDPVIELGVVFHGAGAQRVEVGIDRKIALRQPGVMPHHVQFRGLRQSGRLPAQVLRWQQVAQRTLGAVMRRQAVAPPSRHRFLKDQLAHRRFSASIRRSMSVCAMVSVAHHNDASGWCGYQRPIGNPPISPCLSSFRLISSTV